MICCKNEYAFNRLYDNTCIIHKFSMEFVILTLRMRFYEFTKYLHKSALYPCKETYQTRNL